MSVILYGIWMLKNLITDEEQRWANRRILRIIQTEHMSNDSVLERIATERKTAHSPLRELE